MKALAVCAIAIGLCALPGCQALTNFVESPDAQAVIGQFSNPPLEVVHCVEVIGEWALALAFNLIKVAIPF